MPVSKNRTPQRLRKKKGSQRKKRALQQQSAVVARIAPDAPETVSAPPPPPPSSPLLLQKEQKPRPRRMQERAGFVFYTLVCSGALLIWLFGSSINLYWQQTYHKNSILAALEDYPAFGAGSRLTAALSDVLSNAARDLDAFNERSVARMNAAFFEEAEEEEESLTADEPPGQTSPPPAKEQGAAVSEREEKGVAPAGKAAPGAVRTEIGAKEKPADGGARKEEARQASAAASAPKPQRDEKAEGEKAEAGPSLDASPHSPPPPRFEIGSGDKILYIGDSLMQGIAPHMMASLYKAYKMEGVDISKKSTGLAYPGFFNWPEALETALRSGGGRVKLVVVFLGGNDPWDFPPKKGERFLLFNSPEWEQVYRSRIRDILRIAHEHGANVIWLEAPNMKSDKLNRGMVRLNGMYRSEVEAAHQIFVRTNPVLGYADQVYSKFSTINGKEVAVRSNDGIHFTPVGQRMIASAALEKIKVNVPDPPPDKDGSETGDVSASATERRG